ncbi:hypothetical protein M569_10799, partial [Genlisea aurea]
LYKSRGQHLLTNSRVLDSIVRCSEISPDDTVLEIGPGTGNLTLKLLQQAKNVVALEIDNRMVDILQRRVADTGLQSRLNIICGDALKTELPQFDLVVANIPYGISSPLLAKLLYGTNANPFRAATLLLQKEFAKRLMAEPGDSSFNRLALNMNLMADIEFVMDVSKREFTPPPKVDSAVVKLRPRSHVPEVNLPEWCAFTRTCFGNRNRTLGASFKKKRKLMELMRFSGGHGDGEEEEEEEAELRLFRERVGGVLSSGGFADRRPSKMSSDELLDLLALFNESGVYFHD